MLAPSSSDTDEEELAFKEEHSDKFSVRSCTAEVTLAVKYTVNDIRSRPRNFTIGFCSTFVVVFFVGLILVGISKTPVIFLRFAETSVGEMDAMLLAGGDSPFLNYSLVAPRLDARSELTDGCTPRWLLRGQLYPGFDTTTTTANTNNSNNNNNEPLYAGTSILIGDTQREKELGIGRGWPYRRIGYEETQVLNTILHFLNIPANQGERATLNIDVSGILRQQGIDPNQIINSLVGGGGGTGGTTINPGGALPQGSATVPAFNASTTVTIPGVNGSAPTDLTADEIFRGLGALLGLNLTSNQSAGFADAANAFIRANTDNGTVSFADLFGNGTGGIFTIPAIGDLSSQILSPKLGLTVADGFDEAYGKFPASLGNMLMLDKRYLVRSLIDQICYDTLRQPLGPSSPLLTVPGLPTAQQLEESLNIDHYALIVVAMMKDRFSIYYSATLERTQRITRFSNDLFRALGLGFGGDAQYPIAIALVAFDFFALFLDSLFSSVVAVVLVMGFLLVYTLLLTNTEERSFEVAMLRAQGMNKTQLFLLLASQTTAFIVPALCLAVVLLLVLNAIIEVIMSGATVAPAEPGRIPVAGLVFPVCMGVVIPVIANYQPAKSIMTAALRDALSMYRHAASETTVTVMKLAELGLAPWQTLVGWLLVIGGFIVYYLVPLSFIFNQLSMFFILMNIILLGMLLGLCLITFTIQERVESFVLWFLLWGKDKCLTMLVKKNLSAHSDRNGKAFLMFTITSATIIFGGSLFTLLAISISDTVRVLNGADINVQTLGSSTPLNKSSLDAFLERERARSGNVESWSYATFSLNEFPQIDPSYIARISTVIGFPATRLQVQGIDENFLSTVYPQFNIIYSKDENVQYETTANGAPDVFKSLYTVTPTSLYTPVGEVYTGFPPNRTKPNIFVKYSSVIPVVLSSGAESVLGLSSGSAGTVQFQYALGQTTATRDYWQTIFLTQTRALMDKLSGFPTMTNLQVTFRASIVLTSFDGLRSLLQANVFDFGARNVAAQPGLQYPATAITEPTENLGRLWIRLRAGIDADTRADFVNKLRLYLNPYFHLAVDTEEVVESVKTASDLITYFFYFVAVVAIILDTFMLWLTFISNIQLNSWSVGVLRSLGFTEGQVTRAYVYEALVLVLGSFVCGTVIGLLVATTVILQMSILLTLPFQMNFPYGLFCALLGLSLFSAFAASIVPARAICKRPISLVLKKG